MNERRFDETDLLGWIEGDLPSDRTMALERAMREDAGLRHTLEAMRRDRSLLRAEFVSMWRQAGAKAPLRTVQEAIEAAEREAILAGAGEPRRAGVLAVIGRHRGLAMAASVALLLTAGALVWTNTSPAGGANPGRQIAAEDAAGLTGALEQMDQLAFTDTPPAPGAPETGATTLAAVDGPSPERIEAAIELSERAAARRSISNAMAMTGRGPWSELQSQSPVLPSRVRTLSSGATPVSIRSGQSSSPAAGFASWESGLVTHDLGGRDRAFTRVAPEDIPEALPATYDEAMRLAGLDRLTLRVVSDDPRAVEQELLTLAALHGLEVELKSMGDACGVVTWSVSIPAGNPEDMERLVETICACANSFGAPGAPGAARVARRTYFDVTSLPSRRAGSSVSDGSMRVSVPVLIEPAGVH